MSGEPEPRQLYTCPDCRELVLRVYTGAQFGESSGALVAKHHGVEDAARIGFSADLNGFRAKGLQHSMLLPKQDDFAVSCTKCGHKFSVLVDEVFSDIRARDAQKRRPLPTRPQA